MAERRASLRVLNMDGERPRVWILTGSLGSGKTTPLNRLLRIPETGAAAVFVNEFGGNRGSVELELHL